MVFKNLSQKSKLINDYDPKPFKLTIVNPIIMVIPKGAVIEPEPSSELKESKEHKKNSKKNKSKNIFDELLEDLENYEDGCENRSLMDST